MSDLKERDERAPPDLAKLLKGMVLLCQYCFCAVDGRDDKRGCACMCHSFPVSKPTRPRPAPLKCPQGHGGLRLMEDTKERRVYWCDKCERTGLDGKPTTGMAYKGPPRGRRAQ